MVSRREAIAFAKRDPVTTFRASVFAFDLDAAAGFAHNFCHALPYPLVAKSDALGFALSRSSLYRVCDCSGGGNARGEGERLWKQSSGLVPGS
jgi:hypothetical protein